MEKEARDLEKWLKEDRQGTMLWMENHFEKRVDPRLLVEGAKSVISVLINYYPKDTQGLSDINISKYAYGDDYHNIIKSNLRSLTQCLKDEFGDFDHRIFVDSAPVLERAIASRAGLGWIGKHSLLLSKQKGSFFFIAQIICDLDLEYDGPVSDHCGNCTACIDACPTDAIVDSQIVDSNRCISYLTIELRDEIPLEFKGRMENWAFGCDICQDVCPWNRFSSPTQHPEFKIRDEIQKFSLKDWLEIDESGFKRIFKKSAVKRTKFEGFQRNIRFLNQKGID